MRNQKGFVPAAVLCFMVGFGVITVIAISHIPAWGKAKQAGCETAYQAGDVNCGYAKK